MTDHSDGCLHRSVQKTAGATLYLIEELGDARLRCDQLMRYIDEAVRLIDKSEKKDHFMEVAGHLIEGMPETAFKLQKALQAVALAASRIDYEELKQELLPEKVEELERVLKEVRIRPVKHRSENSMLTPKEAALRIREFARIAREEGSLPLYDVAAFIRELDPSRMASTAVPVADACDKLAGVLESPATQSVTRAQLATLLSRIAMESEFDAAYTTVTTASKPKLTQDMMQLADVEEVKKKFKAENPDITDEQLSEIAEQWTKNKDVVKDKQALTPTDQGIGVHFDNIRGQAISAARAANVNRWRPALLGLFYIVDEIGTILVKLGSMDTQKSEALKREIRQQLPQAAKNIEEMSEFSIQAAEADISKLYHEMTAHLDTFDLAWSRYEKDPEKNKAKLDDALRYMKSLQTVAGVIIRNLEGKAKTAKSDPKFTVEPYEMTDGRKKFQIIVKDGGKEKAYRKLFDSESAADGVVKDLVKGVKDGEGLRDESWEKKAAEQQDPWKTDQEPNEEKALRSRFEQGTPADPTKNMDGEDAEEWKDNTDEHKDDFKAAFGPDGNLAKFEEGKPADPTENMDPEDAKKWKVEHDEHKDNFRAAAEGFKNSLGQVIESKRWKHKETGALASLYGAVPWSGRKGDSKEDWELENVGYTIYWNSNGTVGTGRPPFKTEKEAEDFLKKEAERRGKKAESADESWKA
jgi:hypothetical protein